MEYSNRNYVIGVDIGGTNFRLGMVAEDGELHNFVIESSSILTSKGDALENLKNYIVSYIERFSIGKPLAVAIGFPSTISKDKRTVYSTPNIEGFDNVNVVELMEKALNMPVFIDTDVNFLLQCEISRRSLLKPGIVLGFFIGTGYGNSIYIDGQFLDGKNGVAAELGHIPVLGKNDPCSCGNEGCIELYVSGKRLRELQEKHYPDTAISKIFAEHKDSPIIKEFINALAIPIAIETNILDPDYVIIGGGVVQMEDFPKAELEACILKHTRKPFPAQCLNISYAMEDQKAGVLGAAHYVYQKLKQ